MCVRTNVGYSIVGEFIVQSENTENIKEVIEVLKKWNPNWKPKYFMTDYSETELTAIETVFPDTKTYTCVISIVSRHGLDGAETISMEVFPDTKTYLCDFHREQAWIRWCRNHKHGLTEAETDSLLDMLCACACIGLHLNKPDLAQHYKEAVSQFKSSQVWTSHSSVRQWLSSTWLSIPEVQV